MPLVPAALAAQGRTTTLDVVLRPVREGGAEVTALEVRATLAGPAALGTGAPFSVRAPITYASIRGIADAIENLLLRDAAGVVPLSQQDDEADPAGFPYYRHWRATRTVQPPIEISYRARVPSTGGGGPQFAAIAHAGGFSGAGSGFLVLPEDPGEARIRVRWDLRDLGAGSIAVATFGEGDFELQDEPAMLMQGYYMAGPLGRYPATGSANGFSATWLGQPRFDPEREMEWTAEAYTYLHGFFRDTTRAPFRVFLRVLPGVTGYAGTALRNSFMLGAPAPGADTLGRAPRETLVHELVHHWAVGLQGSQSANTWFAEGLATHYSRLLTMRAGLDSVGAYGRSLNATARSYYTSAARNLSADSIGRLGFSDEIARRMPYLRGALYFADLDARIRVASAGRRTLDDVLIPLFQRIRGGESVGPSGWLELITQELGASARAQFEAVILRGETIVPASDGFGPCFERRPAKFPGAAAGTIDGYEWVRVSAVPDERCGAW